MPCQWGLYFPWPKGSVLLKLIHPICLCQKYVCSPGGCFTLRSCRFAPWGVAPWAQHKTRCGPPPPCCSVRLAEWVQLCVSVALTLTKARMMSSCVHL
jgi:hypothetical protein